MIIERDKNLNILRKYKHYGMYNPNVDYSKVTFEKIDDQKNPQNAMPGGNTEDNKDK